MTTFFWQSTWRAPTRVSKQMVTNTARMASPLTGGMQTATRAGGRWLYTFTWQNLYGADRAEILGALARLNGGENRTAIQEYNHVQRGALGLDSPLIETAPAVEAQSVHFKNVTASVTNWIRAGDLFRLHDGLDGRVYMATDDRDSESDGTVRVDFWPPVNIPPAVDDPVDVGGGAAPLRTKFMLLDDVQYSNFDPFASGETASSITVAMLDDGQ